MEILIFSDSHGRVEGMRRAIALQPRKPDLIVHLGDGAGDLEYLHTRGIPVLSVRGNCDWFTVATSIPEEQVWEELGHKIVILHGHRYGAKSGVGGMLSHAASIGADIVLYGHTHIPSETCVPAGEVVGGVTLERPIYLFNPGSIGRNEQGEGLSFGTLSLTDRHVLFSHGVVKI
ncbi:MAG: YfcE family phosphodiesterase [Clostridia bacterium]|nr:YfcE family phosphodiesterase [Clostridia bacterium]